VPPAAAQAKSVAVPGYHRTGFDAAIGFGNMGVGRRGMEDLREEVYIRAQGQSLTILEAGCGRRWPFNLSDLDIHLTGIDLDQDALALRGDLDNAILGDIRSAHFAPGSFDVIYCSYVLEHVPNARAALENFARWIKPGGLILIRVPDRNSVHGFCTRMTPHWVHVWVKRYVFGNRKSGLPGYGPYPTYHEPIIGRAGILAFARRHGLALDIQPYGRLPGWTQRAAQALAAVSFGKLSAANVNVLYILRSPPHQQ
jgi:SAM-dependent methyltransferase